MTTRFTKTPLGAGLKAGLEANTPRGYYDVARRLQGAVQRLSELFNESVDCRTRFKSDRFVQGETPG